MNVTSRTSMTRPREGSPAACETSARSRLSVARSSAPESAMSCTRGSTMPQCPRKLADRHERKASSAGGERLLGVLGLEEHPVGHDPRDGLIGPLDLEL